jgi:hypothetical protein
VFIIANYLPQAKEEHERACQTLTRLPAGLPHHLLILGGDLQGGWTSSNPKDANVQALPFSRCRRTETPTFTPPHQPSVATCIDHLAVRDPRHLSEQIGDIFTLSTSFLDLKEVLATLHIPVLTEEATAPPPTKTPRVPILQFPVPKHAMETWRTEVAVDSSAAIALSSAMVRTLLDSLACDNNQGRENPPPNFQGTKSAILSIANDFQNIL